MEPMLGDLHAAFAGQLGHLKPHGVAVRHLGQRPPAVLALVGVVVLEGVDLVLRKQLAAAALVSGLTAAPLLRGAPLAFLPVLLTTVILYLKDPARYAVWSAATQKGLATGGKPVAAPGGSRR
jgi:hypothetical protein